jgi:hypothetical protein
MALPEVKALPPGSPVINDFAQALGGFYPKILGRPLPIEIAWSSFETGRVHDLAQGETARAERRKGLGNS